MSRTGSTQGRRFNYMEDASGASHTATVDLASGPTGNGRTPEMRKETTPIRIRLVLALPNIRALLPRVAERASTA